MYWCPFMADMLGTRKLWLYHLCLFIVWIVVLSRPLATCWLRPKDSYGNVTVRSKIMKHLSGLPGVSTSATSNSWLLSSWHKTSAGCGLVRQRIRRKVQIVEKQEVGGGNNFWYMSCYSHSIVWTCNRCFSGYYIQYMLKRQQWYVIVDTMKVYTGKPYTKVLVVLSRSITPWWVDLAFVWLHVGSHLGPFTFSCPCWQDVSQSLGLTDGAWWCCCWWGEGSTVHWCK